MKIHPCTLLATLWLFHLQEATCLIDPITGGIVFGIGSAIFGGYKYFSGVNCKKEECCTREWVPRYGTDLIHTVEARLFGQHIAKSTVISAIEAHTRNDEPPKALTMSFHGLAGSGKNYLASMIAKSYLVKKEKSKYYYFFNGRSEFTLEREVENYKSSLKQRIADALLVCPDSLFVFDEVDMMPSGVLNVLVPFLDYGVQQRIYIEDTKKYVSVKTNKAVYIFLSNTGSREIVDTLTSLWQQGKSRDETTLSDFENLISLGAFNEKGGFHKSDTISTSLIDHYVPFLPLEEKHIRLCIEEEFKSRGDTFDEKLIQKVMSYVTFGPSPHNLFAKSGCKRLQQKVATVLYEQRKQNSQKIDSEIKLVR